MCKPYLIVLVPCLLIASCASVPNNLQAGIATERELSKVKQERNATMQKFVDISALATIKSLGLPKVNVAEGIVTGSITQSQADLVANRTGREACKELAEYFEIMSDENLADLKLRIVVTAINPTSSSASGASALLGVVVPGPFRLPVGLGGLAADASAEDASGKQIIVTKWAKGANALTNDAKVSSIGDAYQLASSFGDAFAKLLINPNNDSKTKRVELDKLQVENNRLLCEKNFGKASVAGRGASILLPLAPEAIDSGAPKLEAEDDMSVTPEVPTPEQVR